MTIKKGDKVKVTTGADKGKVASVLQVFPKTKQILIEGVNLKSKNVRAKREAISLAVQKQPTMEAIRLQDSFSDGVRGLLLYGVKVVRPAALSVLFAKEGADA
jgi:hypothetical protein